MHVALRWATGDDIRSWSGGEVQTPESLNYRAMRPEQRGLYSEETFGPLVATIYEDDRRERFGHISLAERVFGR